MVKIENGEVVALMKTTNGTITIALETELAPRTTTNFIGLAKKGYYDGIIFHRIIKGFMIQWGDPTGTGMWGESIYGKEFKDEFHPNLQNFKYSLSMANSWPHTNGSQFFINVADNNFLDNKHSVFWEVVDGIDNVDKISKVKTNSQDKPEKEIKIISIEIKVSENGVLKDYDFDLDNVLADIEKKNKADKDEKKSKKIENGNTISVHYTWTLENGEKFDSSHDRNKTLDFEVGAWMMIKGFDKAVVWMKIDDKKSITLEPTEAYWEWNEENKQQIPKHSLYDFEKAGFKLEVWTVLPTQMWEFKIIEADEEMITIDSNHKLAWKTLNFDIEIIDIK